MVLKQLSVESQFSANVDQDTKEHDVRPRWRKNISQVPQRIHQIHGPITMRGKNDMFDTQNFHQSWDRLEPHRYPLIQRNFRRTSYTRPRKYPH